MAGLAAAWVASGGGRRDAWLRDLTWRLQEAWAAALFGAVRALFGIRIEVMGGEEGAVRALAHGLGTDEGVLIYPEGTRFTPEPRPAVGALEQVA